MRRVLVNGTFDVLHRGHLCLLNFARAQGDHLLVAIDSDARVKALKGDGRPVFDQQHRAEMLINLRCVDQVEIFSSDQELLDLVDKSDLMVKGDDYQGRPVLGSHSGIKIIYYPRLDYSSTDIIGRIRAQR